MGEVKYAHLYGEWVRLYQDELWSTNRIAAKFGASNTAVNQALRKQGVSIRSGYELDPRNVQGDEWERIYVSEKVSCAVIGERFGVSPATVRIALVSRGVELRDKNDKCYITDPVDRFWNSVRKTSRCWLWTGATGDHGYGVFHPTDASVISTHRYSYELVNGPIENGLLVCHTCDTRNCVRPEHLFLGTHADNSRDMAVKCRGTNVLTPDQVREVRQLHRSGLSYSEISVRYGITSNSIGCIVRRKTYKHVT